MNMRSQATSAFVNPTNIGAVGARADDSAADLKRFLSFAIGEDQYGIDIMAVREIKGWSQVTHLPRQPDYVRGVINLRGVMVPIIDLRCRFGGGPTDATPVHVVIVVQVDSQMVGLLADRVSDIVSFEDAQIQPVPRVTRESRCEFLSGLVTVDAAMIALVDLPTLLSYAAGDTENPSAAEQAANASMRAGRK